MGEKLQQHTFEPPYNEVDGQGDRIVAKNWRSSGHTVVHTNFIRLTPDRQSKRGALWSSKPLGVDSWSGLLTFRISGQGKNLFGDGIGFWITHQSYYSPGDLHGFQEKFTGIGLIFDTFRNTENAAVHKDVTLLINNGEKTYEIMSKTSVGCDTSLRFHSDRSDFTILKYTRVKILVEPDRIGLAIDTSGNGDYIDCAVIDNPGLPRDWLKKAHIGITATTGGLADNHDIISLQSFSDFEVLEQTEIQQEKYKLFQIGENMNRYERFLRIENTINDMMTKNQIREHHIEHAFATIDDHLLNMIAKIEKREDKSDDRLKDVEDKIKKTVAGTLDTRVSRLEYQLQGKVQKTVEGFEEDLVKQMESKFQQTKGTHDSWKTPFMILIGLLLLGAVGLVFFYRKLVSHHLL